MLVVFRNKMVNLESRYVAGQFSFFFSFFFLIYPHGT